MAAAPLLARLAAAPRPPAPGPTGVRVAYFYKPPADQTPAGFVATHFQLIILTHGDEAYVATLRRAGYRGPLLQYIAANEAEGPGPYLNAHAPCDASYPTYQRTVVDGDGEFCAQVHRHESWFLHNARGERLFSHSQSGNGVWRTTYLMNPADKGWRRYLIHRLRQYRRLPFDGFFLDNVDLSRAGLLREPVTRGGVAEFPTDAAYRAAEVAYLAALRAAFPHTPLWANLTHDPNLDGLWKPYLDSLDGVMIEDFLLGWRSSALDGSQAAAQMRNARAAVALGKGILAVEQGGEGDPGRLRRGLNAYWALAQGDQARFPGGVYFRYADAFDEDYRTVSWYPDYATHP